MAVGVSKLNTTCQQILELLKLCQVSGVEIVTVITLCWVWGQSLCCWMSSRYKNKNVSPFDSFLYTSLLGIKPSDLIIDLIHFLSYLFIMVLTSVMARNYLKKCLGVC